MARRQSSAERARRVRARVHELRGWVAEQEQLLTTEQGWRDWLVVAGRFAGEYELDNLLLLWRQRPQATALASYQAWQALGRQVSKGEKGIALLDRRRGRRAAPGELVPVHLFDLAQTHPVEEGAREEPGEREAGGRGGEGVAVDPGVTGALARAVSAHLLGQRGDGRPEGLVEYEVAAATALVRAAHGLPVGLEGAGGITAWFGSAEGARPVQAARASAERVLAAARTALAATRSPALAPEVAAAQLERGRRALDEVRSLADRAEVAAGLTTRAQGRRARSLETVGERDLFPTTARLDRLAAANRAAAAFYREQLAKRPEVAAQLRQRLGGRAVPPEFVVGYAPKSWTGLLDHLRQRGFADRDLVDAGLVQTSNRNTLIDRFRDRVVFGLHDEHGRLAGFIGRAVPLDRTPPEEVPKYLNTSATELFDKGRVLFGLHEQRNRLAAGATAVLVEGPLDVLVIAAHAVDGRVAAVATDGTAVTSTQVASLADAATEPRLVLALDGDQAGQDATLRAAEMLLPLQRPLRVVTLPEGHDPASWASSHPGHVLTPYVDDAWSRPALDVVVDARINVFADRLQWVEGTVDAMRHALRALDGQPPEAVAEQALRIAQRLQLDPLTVAEELGELSKSDRAARRSLEHRATELTDRDVDDAARTGRAHPAALARMATPPAARQQFDDVEPIARSPRHGPARLARGQAER